MSSQQILENKYKMKVIYHISGECDLKHDFVLIDITPTGFTKNETLCFSNPCLTVIPFSDKRKWFPLGCVCGLSCGSSDAFGPAVFTPMFNEEPQKDYDDPMSL